MTIQLLMRKLEVFKFLKNETPFIFRGFLGILTKQLQVILRNSYQAVTGANLKSNSIALYNYF